jgi:NAD(P)-dependent dehydrogenase (short-subunit alcohol dehydrogenase family)
LFKGERAVVTGAASSIGRAIAIAVAREGAKVLLVDVDAGRNAETVRLIGDAGGDCDALICDLAVPGGEREVLRYLGGAAVDMFVHSASPPRHERDDVRGVDGATFDAMLSTNLRAGFFLGRELATGMAAAGRRGRLLYLTSLHAGSPRRLPHYSAAKAGMRAIVQELARAYGPDGIRVNALAPGAVPGGGARNITDAFRSKIALRRVGTPDDMAASAVALLSDRFSPYVTGTTLAVDGGLALFNWIDEPGA